MIGDLLARARARGYPVIIAELGAKYLPVPGMLRAAALARESGADVVKIQSFMAETIATPGASFRDKDGNEISQKEYFRRYQLDDADHAALVEGFRSQGIPWFSTPSSPADVDRLERHSPVCYKTGSDDLTNVRLLRAIARTRRPVILSTGMSTLGEIERAVETVGSAGGSVAAVLHCVTAYPSRVEDANLRVIQTLRERLALPIGLSDHTAGAYTSVLATLLGAEVIEKHFTPDHALALPDDEVSLDPAEWADLVTQVALVPKALGDGVKRVQEAEQKWRREARKSLFAARDLAAGAILAEADLLVMRPLSGIPAEEIDRVVGRKLSRPVATGEPLQWDLLQSGK